MSDSGNAKPKRDWFKTYSGRTLSEATQRPSLESTVDRYIKGSKSKFGLIDIGFAEGGNAIAFSEEDRANHLHIIGATREGKSKFIELLIRNDLKNGTGGCLIDPTPHGATVYKVLKHAIRKGYDKVLLIDPSDFTKFGRVPVIQPLKPDVPPQVMVGNLMNALQVIWQIKDFSQTPRIEKYAPAVFRALMAADKTLADSRYLLSATEYYEERAELVDNEELDSAIRGQLRDAFRTVSTFEQFQSTVNRLNVFSDYLLSLVFGTQRQPLNFQKLIAQGWFILVNLYPDPVWGQQQLQQRTLGTLIVNEILYAISRLEEHGFNKRFYLYIDEAGQYATRKLADILNYHGKTALRLTIAHQQFDQFEDKVVLSAVRQNAKNKVMFFTPDTDDRELMMRDMGYGGDLPDRQVSYLLRQLDKGQATIAIGKQNPKIVRIKNIPDETASAEEIKAFKERIYSLEGFHSTKDIKNELDVRYSPKAQEAPAPTPSQRPVRPPAPKQHGSASTPHKRPAPSKPAAGKSQVLAKPRAAADSRAAREPRKRAETKKPAKTFFNQNPSPPKVRKP